MLKKKALLSLHNKVKSEQCYTVTSDKRVAVFKAGLKSVKEEANA